MGQNYNLSLPFAEDVGLYGEPGDILAGAGSTIILDVETTGLEWWGEEVIGVGVYLPKLEDRVFFIPTQEPECLDRVRAAVRQVSLTPGTRAIFHNAKFDAHFLGLPLWEAKWELYDTAVMAHLYDSRLRKNLGNLETIFLGKQSKEDLVKRRKGQVHEMPLGAVAEYCLNDCRVTYRLANVLYPKLKRLDLLELFRRDMEYVALLQRMERTGVLLDLDFQQRATDKFLSNLGHMEKEFWEAVGHIFNWRSHQKLSYALYEGMGVERPVNPFIDEKGVDHTQIQGKKLYNSTSTNTFVLMEKAKHPLGAQVMALRETDKLFDTLCNWRERMDDNGVLHTSYNQTGTRTGRLSSSKPNLQNVASDIRVRDTQSVYSGSTLREAEYNLRQAIRARPGMTFLSIDYKQQEMRLFGVLAQEEHMLEACRNRLDIHTEVAKRVWPECIGKPDLLRIRREWSKTIGFGLIYGMRTGALQHRLNTTMEAANAIAEQYWTTYPRVMPFLKETVKECEEGHLVRYWSKRIWREDDPNKMYKGGNAKVQGGSSDLIKEAALRCAPILDERGWGWIVMQVHDELVFEVYDQFLPEAARVLAQVMEVEDLLGIPFLTDTKAGPTYGSLKEYSPPPASSGAEA